MWRFKIARRMDFEKLVTRIAYTVQYGIQNTAHNKKRTQTIRH